MTDNNQTVCVKHPQREAGIIHHRHGALCWECWEHQCRRDEKSDERKRVQKCAEANSTGEII